MTHEVQAVGGSREGEGSADMLEGSSLHRHDDMQFSFGNDISGNYSRVKPHNQIWPSRVGHTVWWGESDTVSPGWV